MIMKENFSIMTEEEFKDAIATIKHSSFYKDWDGNGKPPSDLVKFAYDWLCFDCVSPNPSKQQKQDIELLMLKVKHNNI